MDIPRPLISDYMFDKDRLFAQVNLEGVVVDREDALFEIRGEVRELKRQVTDSRSAPTTVPYPARWPCRQYSSRLASFTCFQEK